MLVSLFYSFIFILSFALVLSFLVFFHELGHYSVARMFKVNVERFSIGFGRPLLKWRAKSGTEWTFNAIPLGGYVKFFGDAGAASNPDQTRLDQLKANFESQGDKDSVLNCFHFKPLWQRVLIVLAGPLANFILAALIFAGIVIGLGTQDTRSIVMEVQSGGAAAEAGVQVGDQFLTLNGADVSLSQDLVSYIVIRSNEVLTAQVERDGEIISFPITPRRLPRRDIIGGKNNVGTIGIGVGSREDIVTRRYGLISGLHYGVGEVGSTIAMTGTYIGRIFTGREDGKALGGVVRIATLTGKTAVDTAKLDISVSERFYTLFLRLLSLSAALSIGLGVANLMPIPALDGGHLLYYGYEAVVGRPLSEKKQELGFKVGFAVLLTLLIVFTWNDINYIRSLSS